MKSLFFRFSAKLLVIAIILTTPAAISGCRYFANDGDFSEADHHSQYVYTYEILAIPDNLGNIGNLTYHNERLYFTSTIYDADDRYDDNFSSFSIGIYSISIDGTDLIEYTGYAPRLSGADGIAGGVLVRSIFIDAKGYMWVIEETGFFHTDPYNPTSPGNYVFIRKLDSSGAELLCVDVSYLNDINRQSIVNALAVETFGDSDSNGQNDRPDFIYLSILGNIDNFQNMHQTIYVINTAGTLLLEHTTGSALARFLRISDNSVAMAVQPSIEQDEWSQAVYTYDYASNNFLEEVRIPVCEISSRIFPGYGEYDFLINDDINIYGFISETEESVILLNWLETGIHHNMQEITPVPDDRLLSVGISFDETGQMRHEVYILNKVERSTMADRTVLTLATFGLFDDMRSAVIDFNRSNEDYRIEVIDFSVFNFDDTNAGGLARLRTEIVTGKSPDILDVSYINYTEYAGSGLLVDLYPFIDSSSIFSRDDFVAAAISASEVDGNLYKMPTQFSIMSIAGSASVIGTEGKWDIDGFLSVLQKYPEADIPLGLFSMGRKVTNLSVLRSFGAAYLDSFLDIETGAAQFNSQEFIKLLEFSNRFPNESDSVFSQRHNDLIAANRQIMMIFDLANLTFFLTAKFLFGDDVVFAGFPSEYGNRHIVMVNNELAVSAGSSNKEGAWLFIETVLQESRQMMHTYGFPVNAAALKETLTAGAADTHEMVSIQGGSIEFFEGISQDEIGIITDIVGSAAGMPGFGIDESLWNIINAAASDYYNGFHSAEAAADIIQSKVTILLSERN